MNTHEEILDRAESISGLQSFTAAGEGHEPMRLWLVDDNATFRDLLAALLTLEGDVECTAQFSCAEDALSALTNQSPPDAILLDIQMGGKSGLDAIRPIKALARDVHVFMLTTFYDHDRKVRALENGASGFLLKSYPATEILRQIQQVRPGIRY